MTPEEIQKTIKFYREHPWTTEFPDHETWRWFLDAAERSIELETEVNKQASVREFSFDMQQRQIQKLTEENEALLEALRFYGNEKYYADPHFNNEENLPYGESDTSIGWDGGAVARKVLKRFEEK